MSTLNFEEARHHMVVQQIQPWNVHDDNVLELLQRVPREDYVPAEYRHFAFTDMNIPLGNGQEMLSPKLEAFILQAVQPGPQEKVLEIGTGSGYMTALLASQARHVISVEIDEQFHNSAAEKLAAHQVNNVTLEMGDASHGWDKDRPYDVIVITGSLPLLPENFQRSLNVGGRLFAIVGEAPVMEAMLITRVRENEWIHQPLLETCVPALLNAAQPDHFSL